MSDTWNWARLWLELCMSQTSWLEGREVHAWTVGEVHSSVSGKCEEFPSQRGVRKCSQWQEFPCSTAEREGMEHCCVQHAEPTAAVLCQQQALWGISCTLGRWLRALGRAGHPNSSAHSLPATTCMPGSSSREAAPWVSCVWHWMWHLKHFSMLCSLWQRRFHFRERLCWWPPACRALAFPAHTFGLWQEWAHGPAPVEGAKADEMKFILLLCQLYCSSGSTGKTWISRKP